MMNVKDLLTQARAKIEDPANWITHSLVRARVKAGGTSYLFCARGALYDVACGGELHRFRSALYMEQEYNKLRHREDVREAERLLDACAREISPSIDQHTSSPISRLNDNSDIGGHAKVLQAYDCAIEKAD